MSRLEQLRANLAAVHERIAGRDVTLVVVTKTHPASDVELLASLGVTDIGENRHPEAETKAGLGPRLHFIGGLQTNKAGAVARYADVVQSVDRPKLAQALSRGAVTAGRELECLVQVDFEEGADAGRAGIAPSSVLTLADEIAELPGLRLGGVMTVAPLGHDPRPYFDHLVEIGARVRADHPEAAVISAGMSGDFEHAILAGATHLRVGSSILGERPALR